MTTLNRESVSSIQLALDLEHDLNNEEHTSPTPRSTGVLEIPQGHEYDPEVLTSIVIQLRANLATVSQERDESIQALADAGQKNATLEAKTADLTELLEKERKRAEKAELERDEAIKTAQENEEQVNLLRSKVEESRRGVMRLQAESRRMSTQTAKTGPLPLDLHAANGMRSPGTSSGFPSVMSAKRSSFQIPPPSSMLSPSSRPVGGGHRRISSMSDPGPANAPLAEPLSIDGLPPSPATHTFEALRNADGNTIKAKRMSLIMKRDASPPSAYGAPSSILTAEVESLRTELSALKKELETAKHEAAEANDKRDASDACIKALREFIAEQAVGEAPALALSSSSIKDDAASTSSFNVQSPVMSLKGLRLPPLPTEDNIPESAASSNSQQKKGGWGIRLWRSESISKEAEKPVETSMPPPALPSPGEPVTSPSSTPLTNFVSSWTRSVSSVPSSTSGGSQTAQSPPPEVAPLRGFSFFSKAPPGSAAANHNSAASISSTRTPELSRSESTSPTTDTRSLTTDEGEALAATVLHVQSKETRGDVTPTLASAEVEVVGEGDHVVEKMEAVAL